MKPKIDSITLAGNHEIYLKTRKFYPIFTYLSTKSPFLGDISMLPFLKKQRQSTGIAMEYRKPDAESENMKDDAALESAAEDMMKAMSSGDKKAAAAALRAAFQILDSEPHEEGPHLEE